MQGSERRKGRSQTWSRGKLGGEGGGGGGEGRGVHVHSLVRDDGQWWQQEWSWGQTHRTAQPSWSIPTLPPPHFFEKRRRRRRHHLHWVTIHVLALVLSFICFSSTKFQRLQNQKLPPPLLFLFACVLSYKKIPLYGPSLNLKFLRKKMFGDFLNLKS